MSKNIRQVTTITFRITVHF